MEYCWCEQGWSGDRCQVKSSSDLCNERSCAANAQCVILNEEKKQMKCICPLERSGDQCYIKYNFCDTVQCPKNGTCLPLDQRGFKYGCACEDDYSGCASRRTRQVYSISITSIVTDLSIVPAIIVIFRFLADQRFIQVSRTLYKNIALPTTLKPARIERFGFVQMFQNLSSSVYYLVVKTPMNILSSNRSVKTKNRCKNVTEIFNQTILHEYTYLRRLKLYHLPCTHDHDLECFYDEYRMCVCTESHNSDCYFFNHQHGHCDYCQNGGLCLRQNSDRDK